MVCGTVRGDEDLEIRKQGRNSLEDDVLPKTRTLASGGEFLRVGGAADAVMMLLHHADTVQTVRVELYDVGKVPRMVLYHDHSEMAVGKVRTWGRTFSWGRSAAQDDTILQYTIQCDGVRQGMNVGISKCNNVQYHRTLLDRLIDRLKRLYSTTVQYNA